jgi:hypothetical protein
MTKPTLIGLTGHAGSGKSTAAKLLEAHGYAVMHIADPIRRIAYESMPRIRRVVDAYGWDTAKRINPEVRPALQDLGDAIRNVLGEYVLLNLIFDRYWSVVPMVVADIRADIEAELVKTYGGTIIEITREGTSPANGHHLERGIDRNLIDVTIANDGTLEDLEAALIEALELEDR